MVDVNVRDEEEQFTSLHTLQDTATLLTFYPSGDSTKTGYYVKITQLPENIHWDNEDMETGQIQVTCEEIFRG